MNFLNLGLGELLGLVGAISAGVVALYLLDRSKRNQIVATLRFWTPADWAQTFPNDLPSDPPYSRHWIIWHLIEHDLHHGGEISLTLGMHGLTAPDL